MKMNFTNQFKLMFLLLLMGSFSWAQQQTPLDLALRFVEDQYKTWELTEADVADLGVSNLYESTHNGVTHLYFLQRHEGIELYNAMLTVAITFDGKVYHSAPRFVKNLNEKVNAITPALTAANAISKAAQHLKLDLTEELRVKEQKSQQEFLFEKGNLSHADIPVKLRYQLMEDGDLRLAWDLAIDQKNNPDYWSLRVDALTGEILDKNNYTVYCQFEKKPTHHHTTACTEERPAFTSVKETLYKQNKLQGDGASYRVFAPPVESPAHGDRTLVEDPADPIASPFGWHDTNGVEGAEYTITRGNNVHAYLDVQGNDSSSGDEPDGGADLVFDFPYDADAEPGDIKPTAVTNLFFMNNFLHDFTHNFGLTEVAGAFQQNNYGNGGVGGDYVIAQAQDGAELPVPNLNNANFGTPPDGGNGRMQMYIWNRSGGGADRLLTVNAPATVAGTYPASVGDWGLAINSTNPTTGEVVIVEDGVSDPFVSDGCEPILNGADLQGKIALIDRGGCEFGFKALSAEEQGAIGVIICNFEDAFVNMGAGAVGGQVTIPAIFMSVVDCQTIREFVGTGLNVTIVAPEEVGPDFLDGDLDNGIVAHEFGHGVSNRLTGGPGASGCLSNGEQMGEGWSDFFTLITTVNPTDVGSMPQGVGTFVTREPNDGRGIRTFPYSNDMGVNPHTYGDVASLVAPHGLGSVWCVMLWDMYWAFVDEYGWDEDIKNMTAGNNMAIQLVMDGMKLQPCGPGFVDGRDAILMADEILFEGANQCLIWEVFARRGLGYSADQGDPNNNADGIEAFDVHPFCIPELKITKAATELINAGEEIEITLRVINHKPDPVTNVVVTDEIPAGTNYITGSANIEPTVQSGLLTFELGDMPFDVEQVITYKLSTPTNQFSIQQFYDDVPDELAEDNWEVGFLGDTPPTIWTILDVFANSGSWAWAIEDVDVETRQLLQLAEPFLVEGDQPVFRFYHLYDTEAGFDGGLIDISTDDGVTWSIVNDEFFKNGYPLSLAYGTFTAPNLSAFSGNSNGWIPTYIDLSDYVGQEILLRFRFGTDEMQGGLGWFVDDMEFMDMFNYNSEACVMSEEGDQGCTIAPDRGTIVESGLVSTLEPLEDVSVAVFPNPVEDQLIVSLSSDQMKDVTVSLMTLDGKTMMAKKVNAFGQTTLPINVSHLPSGFYLVKVHTADGMLMKKVVVQ